MLSAVTSAVDAGLELARPGFSPPTNPVSRGVGQFLQTKTSFAYSSTTKWLSADGHVRLIDSDGASLAFRYFNNRVQLATLLVVEADRPDDREIAGPGSTCSYCPALPGSRDRPELAISAHSPSLSSSRSRPVHRCNWLTWAGPGWAREFTGRRVDGGTYQTKPALVLLILSAKVVGRGRL